MRSTNKEAARTRARIVAAAADKFREDGIVATGLNPLMRAAGLTHGGFYKHFASKDQLVEEAWAHMAKASLETIRHATASAPVHQRARAFVDAYLSKAHRDNPATGCGFAALGPEIGRSEGALRRATSESYNALVRSFAELHPGFHGADGLARARVMVATMMGALICARAIGDPALSDAILDGARASLSAELGSNAEIDRGV